MYHKNHTKLWTAYDFLLVFITDFNEMIQINQSWPEIAELSFKLFCAYAQSFDANKFITPVLVNKMKYWNANIETVSSVNSLTLMAHVHKMLKTYNNNISASCIKNMFYNYVYSQQPSYLMEFKCNFHFMPIFTLKLMAF